MMKEEFEDRVGLQVTNKEYAQIEEAYVAGNLDKDVFCKEWLNKLTGAEYKAMKEREIKLELPPMAKGTFTTKRYMEEVIRRVEKTPEYEKFKSKIDYMLADDLGDATVTPSITKYEFNFMAAISWPASEGVYVECWLCGDFDNSGRQKIDMGTIKTLEDSKEALILMGELTGLLIWVAGEVLQQQMDRGYFEQ